jgi:group I intron endonuclease
MINKPGIYLLTNKVNGHKYVGMSNNIKRRWTEHRTKTHKKRSVIGRAMLKHGIDNFSFEIIEIIENIDDLPKREEFWINEIKPKYNMNLGGLGNRAYVVTEKTKKILKEKAKAAWNNLSQETKNKIISNFKKTEKGHYVSEETKEKLRKANLGKKKPKEVGLKISKALKGKSKSNEWNYKPIYCLKDGVYFASYMSTKEARKACGSQSITAALKGRQKTAAGFEWKYGNPIIF